MNYAFYAILSFFGFCFCGVLCAYSIIHPQGVHEDDNATPTFDERWSFKSQGLMGLTAFMVLLMIHFYISSENWNREANVIFHHEASNLLSQAVAAEKTLTKKHGQCSSSATDMESVSPHVASLMFKTFEEAANTNTEYAVVIERGALTGVCTITAYADVGALGGSSFISSTSTVK